MASAETVSSSTLILGTTREKDDLSLSMLRKAINPGACVTRITFETNNLKERYAHHFKMESR